MHNITWAFLIVAIQLLKQPALESSKDHSELEDFNAVAIIKKKCFFPHLRRGNYILAFHVYFELIFQVSPKSPLFIMGHNTQRTCIQIYELTKNLYFKKFDSRITLLNLFASSLMLHHAIVPSHKGYGRRLYKV